MERTGLFVRIPAVQAARLDVLSARTRRPKQEIVSALLERHLDETEHDDPVAVSSTDVLTLEEAAALLRVEEVAVLGRAEAGELPGRRFGEEWRFSRGALHSWLAGSDGRRQTGFTL